MLRRGDVDAQKLVDFVLRARRFIMGTDSKG
jgi:hypothetical protein